MPLLSILVPTLRCRAHLFARLLTNLGPQLNGDCQLISLCDDGDEPTGLKRNRLLCAAETPYVVFVDDDDLVSDAYRARVVQALQGEPEIVTFRQRIYDDDVLTETVARRVGGPRPPNHLNPVRREIALAIRFPERNCGEDVDYANRLADSLTLTESFIDADLYFYHRRSDRRWERNNHNP